MDSIAQAVDHFLNNLSGNTKKSYSYDFKNETTGLLVVLKGNHLPPDASIKMLKEQYGVEWIQHLKTQGCRPATIARRISAFKNLLRFCALRYSLQLDSNRFGEMLSAAKLKPTPKNLMVIPMEKIEKVIEYCLSQQLRGLETFELLREVRNRTFIITLADTGLRVGEAFALKRGAINWTNGSATIIGKGDKRGTVRFSNRLLDMLDWMKRGEEKASLKMPASISTTPLFCRYTKKKIKGLDTATGRQIVPALARAALGSEYIEGEITPHSFRHYFVMVILGKTGNLKKAKELARHSSIETTNRYTQMTDKELDIAYKDIFNKKEKE